MTMTESLCRAMGVHQHERGEMCYGCRLIQQTVDAATKEERERCAKIAENPDNLAYPEGRAKWTADVIARRIRQDD